MIGRRRTRRRLARMRPRHEQERRARLLKRALRAAAAGALLAVAAARVASAQTAGTTHLLAAPGSWPTTGAIGTTTALALDPSAVYLNPAGLATQDERTVLLHHGLLQFETDWDLAAVAYPIPGLGAVGLGLARVGTSGIEAYDAQNQSLGSLGYTETSVAASVARRVHGSVHAGVTFKVLSQSLGDVSAAAPGLDLGVVFRPATLRGAQVGIAAQNLLAGSIDLGGRGESLDRSFRLGAASPSWPFSRLLSGRVAVDLGRQGSDPTQVRAAVEVARAGLGAFRVGLNNGRPVVGLGVDWRRYGFDVALVQGEVEMTQQFALRLAWGEPVSEYEARRRAAYAKAAEDSLRARHAAQIAKDRARAEAAEAQGDWESALVLWEVLARELPDERSHAGRAERARGEIRAKAQRDLEADGARRMRTAFTSMLEEALRRGDLEDAEALRRALARPDLVGAALPESLARLETALREARERTGRRTVVRADSLRKAGRVLEAADEAALALRLLPEDEGARAVWRSLEALVGKSAAQAAELSRKLEALGAVHEASVAFNEGRYAEARTAIRRALTIDPSSVEARAWRDRIDRRLTTPKPELDARVKQLYVRGMEAFSAGNYKEALRNWEQILVLDPLNESARRNVLEARERMKSEASR